VTRIWVSAAEHLCHICITYWPALIAWDRFVPFIHCYHIKIVEVRELFPGPIVRLTLIETLEKKQSRPKTWWAGVERLAGVKTIRWSGNGAKVGGRKLTIHETDRRLYLGNGARYGLRYNYWLLRNHTRRIQWYHSGPSRVTPNKGSGPPIWALFYSDSTRPRPMLCYAMLRLLQ